MLQVLYRLHDSMFNYLYSLISLSTFVWYYQYLYTSLYLPHYHPILIISSGLDQSLYNHRLGIPCDHFHRLGIAGGICASDK